MLWDIVIFIVSLIILVKGADLFVESASRLAKFFGVSELLIGLTFVALGTSLPELGSSVAAALLADPSIAAGNIIGSNIANIALVIGVSSLFGVIHLKRVEFFRDGIFMMAISLLFYLLALDGSLSLIDALILLVLLVYYLLLLYRWEKGSRDSFRQEIRVLEFFRLRKYMANWGFTQVFNQEVKKKPQKEKEPRSKDIKAGKQGVFFVLSCALVFISARFLVISAEHIADELGISSAVIGMTAIAIGTSLPELSVSIASIVKGHGSLLIGNIIGSNIANLLLVGGVTALITPLTFEPLLLRLALPAMLVLSLLFLIVIRRKWRITHWEGITFLSLYGVVLFLLFF